MDRDALWLWFTSVFGFSSNRTNALLDKYNSIDGLFKIPEMVLMELPDFTLNQKKEILISDFEPYRRKIANLLKKGIHVISIDNPLYPEILKEIKNPPFVLYACGDLESLNHSYPITMVGTRKPDSYGQRSAKNISAELASMGACIVSGLAGGCDSLCHMGALSKDGITIGVCACGIDVDYPKGSGKVKRDICKRGCVISEFPPHFPVRPANFPIRNRILSGLSLATVIIQCSRKSGTMLTANYALNQNRDLYVLTGDPYNPLSEGPLSLLEDGASPFLGSESLMTHYKEIYKKPAFISKTETNIREDEPSLKKSPSGKKPKADTSLKKTTIPDDLPREQKDILLALADRPLQIDELAARLALPSYRLLSILTQLELLSYIEAMPGGIYKAL